MTSYGIDFGTTNSVVAVSRNQDVSVLATAGNLGTWEVLPHFRHLTPSVFGILPAGDPVVGWEAKLRSPQRLEAVKRLLRGDQSLMLGGKSWSPEQVCSALFRGLRESAASNGVDLDDAVITVPANAPGLARLRTRAAAGMAGVRALALVNEPTAAAMGYVQRSGCEGRILVYDFGGGTLDVTVLEAKDGVFLERASKGIALLGGLDLDRLLRDLAFSKAGLTDVTDDWEFALDIEQAKIRLSYAEAVCVAMPNFGALVDISREEFEGAIAARVESSLAPVARCLDDLGMRGADLDAVLLVGGTSAIPLVRRRVTDLLGVEPVGVNECEPLTAVARGAAVAASILTGEYQGAMSFVSEHALGVDSQADDGGRKFSTILPRGSRLPRKGAKAFKFTNDHPDRLRIDILEGDPELPVDDPATVRLGRYTVEFDQASLAGDPKFRLELSYDASGIVQVSAISRGTGQPLLSARCDFLDDEHVAERRARDFAEVDEFFTRPLPALPEPDPQSIDQPLAPEFTLVVDGSNLAWIGRKGRNAKPSHEQLSSALDALREAYPDADVLTFVDATYRHLVDPTERSAVEEAFDEGLLHQPPSATKGKADALICRYAQKLGATIVSNDSFKELQGEHPWLLEAELLGASLLRGVWVFEPRSVVQQKPTVIGRLLRRGSSPATSNESRSYPLECLEAHDEAPVDTVPAPREAESPLPAAAGELAKPLYAWQAEALEAWVAAGQRGVVEAVTGTGKTMVGIKAAADALGRDERVLVLTPTVDLARQWHQELTAALPVAVGLRGGGSTDNLRSHRVLVATVQSAPFTRKLPLGARGVLIADECHRYGSRSWSKALDESFDSRLGLTATYQRDDLGNDEFLAPYFGEIVTSVDYARARADDIIAPYSIALVGVPLTPDEREDYDAFDRQAKSAAQRLISEHGLPERPFGEFMKAVQWQGTHGVGRAKTTAWAYLSAFTKRRDLLARSEGKLKAVEQLAPALRSCGASLFFTQTKEAARQCVDVCQAAGVTASALYSGQDDDEREHAMTNFRDQNIRVLASPRLLDEGVNIPEADLGVIVAASHSRRQMIQRLGRVLRKKQDGRRARLVVLFAEETTEDPGVESENPFLMLAGKVADEVRTFSAKDAPRDLVAFLNDFAVGSALTFA